MASVLLFKKTIQHTHNFGKRDLIENTILSRGIRTPNIFIIHSVIINQYSSIEISKMPFWGKGHFNYMYMLIC